MKRRIERATEQRTAMLNGVSHDLRTILTRFKLSLALLDNSADSELLQRDVDEMGQILRRLPRLCPRRRQRADHAYRHRLDAGGVRAGAERHGAEIRLQTRGNLKIRVRPMAMKRCIGNLVANAQRHADHAEIPEAGPDAPDRRRRRRLWNTPGISRGCVRPFYRLDEARNQDQSGAGLGLAIARDIAVRTAATSTSRTARWAALGPRFAFPSDRARARGQTAALIQRVSWLFGPAPVLVATCFPPLKTIRVGIERMPYLPATPGFSSTLSLAIFTLPCISVAISSSAGAIIRQGPHHSAQKSTTTGSLELMTSASKLASVTLAVWTWEPLIKRLAAAGVLVGSATDGVKPGRRCQNSLPPFGTGRDGPITTTSPSSSGNPSVKTSERKGPICRGAKLTTAATCRPTSASGR